MSTQICFTISTANYILAMMVTKNVLYRAFYINYVHRTIFIVYCAAFPVVALWSIPGLKRPFFARMKVEPTLNKVKAEQDLRLAELSKIWNSHFDGRK